MFNIGDLVRVVENSYSDLVLDDKAYVVAVSDDLIRLEGREGDWLARRFVLVPPVYA